MLLDEWQEHGEVPGLCVLVVFLGSVKRYCSASCFCHCWVELVGWCPPRCSISICPCCSCSLQHSPGEKKIRIIQWQVTFRLFFPLLPPFHMPLRPNNVDDSFLKMISKVVICNVQCSECWERALAPQWCKSCAQSLPKIFPPLVQNLLLPYSKHKSLHLLGDITIFCGVFCSWPLLVTAEQKHRSVCLWKAEENNSVALEKTFVVFGDGVGTPGKWQWCGGGQLRHIPKGKIQSGDMSLNGWWETEQWEVEF